VEARLMLPRKCEQGNLSPLNPASNRRLSPRSFANPNRRGIVGVARSGGMAEWSIPPGLKTDNYPRQNLNPSKNS
jgi:hypothetical protein